MKPKTVIPLVLGVVVGGAAIKMVVDVVSNAQAATRTDMASCVVAKVDIKFAEEITADKVKQIEWPKGSLPASHFSKVEDVVGRVSDMLIPMDVPIYGTMLAPEGTPPGIMVRIKPGYRAVAVPIDEVTGVSYQVAPGDRVDIVALVKQRSSQGAITQSSRIILQNIEVATVGRALNSDKKGDSAKSVARSVTLLLTPEEVTRLHLAQSLGGRLSLALRGNQDGSEETAENTGTAEDTLEAPAAPVKVARREPPPRPESTPPWNVKVISGNKIEDVNYQWRDGRWHIDGTSEENGVVPPPARGVVPPGTPDTMNDNDLDSQIDSERNEDWAEES